MNGTWNGVGMAAALLFAAGCTETSSTETSRSASAAIAFTAHGEGYRAESVDHRLDIVRGVFTLAARPSSTQEHAQSLAVELETVAARRGLLALDLSVLQSGLAAPDTVETVRGDFIEQLRSTATGAEQSWHFDAAPGQNGELTVEVEADQVKYLGADQDGLFFERPNTLRLSYSHGVWIDADGDRRAIPARYVAGRISLTVPAEVVAASSFPAVLDPQIIITPIGGTLQ